MPHRESPFDKCSFRKHLNTEQCAAADVRRHAAEHARLGHMKIMDAKLISWLPTVTAVASIAVFAATTFVYFAAHRKGLAAGYLPFFAGALSFAAIVGMATYVSAPHGARVRGAVAAILVSAASFGIIFLFILTNALGS